MAWISNIFFLVMLSFISTVFAAAVLTSFGMHISNAKNIFLVILAVYTAVLIFTRTKKSHR